MLTACVWFGLNVALWPKPCPHLWKEHCFRSLVVCLDIISQKLSCAAMFVLNGGDCFLATLRNKLWLFSVFLIVLP